LVEVEVVLGGVGGVAAGRLVVVVGHCGGGRWLELLERGSGGGRAPEVVLRPCPVRALGFAVLDRSLFLFLILVKALC
jgi:hypothetical protein